MSKLFGFMHAPDEKKINILQTLQELRENENKEDDPLILVCFGKEFTIPELLVFFIKSVPLILLIIILIIILCIVIKTVFFL